MPGPARVCALHNYSYGCYAVEHNPDKTASHLLGSTDLTVQAQPLNPALCVAPACQTV